MSATALRFISLFLTSLLVGTMFGVWLGFNPAALSAAAYVESRGHPMATATVRRR